MMGGRQCFEKKLIKSGWFLPKIEETGLDWFIKNLLVQV
jgi:hypothetical protein